MAPPLASARGQILILTALMMTTLLGIAALSIDASFMYDRRNTLAASADAAAKSVAMEIHRNPGIGPAAMRTFAESQVVAHGLTPAGCGSATNAGICINRPPMSGPFAGAGFPDYVEVTVAQVTPTFFGAVLGWFSATPGARAVAGTSNGPNCVVVLGPGASALTVGNNTTLNLSGCSVSDGGGLDLKPNAVIEADSVGIATGSCAGVPNCIPNVPPPTDPLANLAPPSPAPAHTCTMPVSVSADVTISVATADQYYCGMTINNAVVTFTPGIYFIAGPITALNGGAAPTINGAGVMFFLAGPLGAFNLGASNFVTMNLSAPTSGPYTAILFYQERGNTNDAVLSKNNGDSINLSGAMYFPDAALTMKNGNGVTNDCALIVAKTVDIMNNTNLSNACTGYGGGSPILTVSIAE